MELTSIQSGILPYFTVEMPPVIGVMSALLLAFVLGLGVSISSGNTIKQGFSEFREVIMKLISAVIIPFLPIYIFGIFVSDISNKQGNIKDLQSKIEAKAKTAIDLAKDTYILSAFSEIPEENKLDNITLTPDNAYKCLVWLSKTLKNNNAIQLKNDQVFKSNQAGGDAMPYVIINPDVEAILLQSPDFIHATQAGDRVLREGSIGTIAGLDVLVSTNLPTTEKKVNIMAGINDAIAFVGNISHIEAIRDEKFFGTNIRGLYVYGKKVVLPKALAGMTVDVSAADSIVEAAA